MRESIDMSPEAITLRLRQAAELRETSLLLQKGRIIDRTDKDIAFSESDSEESKETEKIANE